MEHIVVWDPLGHDKERGYWEGSIVDEARAKQLEARGVAVLPVEKQLFQVAGGFAKRCWGAGWPLDHQQPGYLAPLALYLSRAETLRGLAWLVRLVPDERFKGKAEGSIRLAPHTGQGNPLHAGYTPEGVAAIAARELGEPDAYGGWTRGGRGLLYLGQDGFHGFAIYGAAPGLRVAWVAATQYRHAA
ncbi:MAG: hypothetical protein PVSMB8_00050 [Vulcanimicrobiaceae bacterium]